MDHFKITNCSVYMFDCKQASLGETLLTCVNWHTEYSVYLCGTLKSTVLHEKLYDKWSQQLKMVSFLCTLKETLKLFVEIFCVCLHLTLLHQMFFIYGTVSIVLCQCTIHLTSKSGMSGAVPLLFLYIFMSCTGTPLPLLVFIRCDLLLRGKCMMKSWVPSCMFMCKM